jgi:CHASE3 domain sensor protein
MEIVLGITCVVLVGVLIAGFFSIEKLEKQINWLDGERRRHQKAIEELERRENQERRIEKLLK